MKRMDRLNQYIKDHLYVFVMVFIGIFLSAFVGILFYTTFMQDKPISERELLEMILEQLSYFMELFLMLIDILEQLLEELNNP